MSDHIRIPDIAPRIHYIGNGTQTVFIYPFPIFNSGQLRVSLDNSLQTVHFAVLGAGNSTGGTVVFDTAPASGIAVMLERILPLQRISDFIEGGELSANALNGEFDYMAAALQQIHVAQQAMLHVGSDEIAPVTLLPGCDIRANKVLGFDENGAPEMVETAQTYASPGFSQNGIGAVSRTLTDKVREQVSVKDFGAVGDGIADDTAALQNALAAHDAVFLPPGTYRVMATIEIGSNKTMQGAGPATILKATTNTIDTIALTGSTSVLRDLTIDGGETGLRLYGKTAPCRSNIAANVTLKNQLIGLELDGYNTIANPCEGNYLRDIVIEKPSVHGVLVTRSGPGAYPNANHFSGVRVTSLGTTLSGHGIFVQAARVNNSFTDCDIVVAGTAAGCLRIGGESQKTLLGNITCDGSGAANIVLDAGSQDTLLLNMHAVSGFVLTDNSGGSYTLLGSGADEKHRLGGKTRIVDLTVEQQRYSVNVVAPPGAVTLPVDIGKAVTLASAANGVVTLQLPKAAAGNAGSVAVVKKTDTSANTVLITENGGSGPDGRSLALGSQHDTATVISDGTSWRMLSTNSLFYNTQIRSAAGTYIPDISRQLHLVDATSGLTIVQLPPANSVNSIGRQVTIKKTDASANIVRITEEGLFGPDNAAINMNTRYQAVTMLSNGTAWHVIAKV